MNVGIDENMNENSKSTQQMPTSELGFGAEHHVFEPLFQVFVHTVCSLPQGPMTGINLPSGQLGDVFLHSYRKRRCEHVVTGRLDKQDRHVDLGRLQSGSKSAEGSQDDVADIIDGIELTQDRPSSFVHESDTNSLDLG